MHGYMPKIDRYKMASDYLNMNHGSRIGNDLHITLKILYAKCLLLEKGQK